MKEVQLLYDINPFALAGCTHTDDAISGGPKADIGRDLQHHL